MNPYEYSCVQIPTCKFCLFNERLPTGQTLVILTDGSYSVLTKELLASVEFGPAHQQYRRHVQNSKAVQLAKQLRESGQSVPDVKPVYGPHPGIPIAPLAEIKERIRAAIMATKFSMHEQTDNILEKGFFASADQVPYSWLANKRSGFRVQTAGTYALWSFNRHIRTYWGGPLSNHPDLPAKSVVDYLPSDIARIWRLIVERAKAWKVIDAWEAEEEKRRWAERDREFLKIQEDELQWQLSQMQEAAGV